MKANETKLVHVTFTTRRETCPPVHINDMQIPQENHVKYLGLHLDRRLTWHTHIFAKRKQLELSLTKMYWLLGHKSKLSTNNKILIYKAILKPIWTYGIQLGYNIKFKHGNFRTFSIQSLAANSGCPLVRVKFRHP
jgi:hypothetical protein